MSAFLAYVLVPMLTAAVIVGVLHRERIVRWLYGEENDDE